MSARDWRRGPERELEPGEEWHEALVEVTDAEVLREAAHIIERLKDREIGPLDVLWLVDERRLLEAADSLAAEQDAKKEVP